MARRAALRRGPYRAEVPVQRNTAGLAPGRLLPPSDQYEEANDARGNADFDESVAIEWPEHLLSNTAYDPGSPPDRTARPESTLRPPRMRRSASNGRLEQAPA